MIPLKSQKDITAMRESGAFNTSPICIFLGRPGSGKGTQAELIQQKLGFTHIGSGQLLRERGRTNDFSGRKLQHLIQRGKLAPSAVIFQIWMNELERVKEKSPDVAGIIFDGSPRKLLEARLIDEALGWFEWNERIIVFSIEISSEESMKRLLARGREDDTEKSIKQRLEAYEEETLAVLDFYRREKFLTTINGEQTIEDIHSDIMKVLQDYV